MTNSKVQMTNKIQNPNDKHIILEHLTLGIDLAFGF